GIVAHAARTEQVDAELLTLWRNLPRLFGARRLEQLFSPLCEILVELEVLRMILVRHPNCGNAPRVFHGGIERDAVGFDGERRRVPKRIDGTIVISREQGLVSASPLRGVRRKTVEREVDRRRVETIVE